MKLPRFGAPRARSVPARDRGNGKFIDCWRTMVDPPRSLKSYTLFSLFCDKIVEGVIYSYGRLDFNGVLFPEISTLGGQTAF